MRVGLYLISVEVVHLQTLRRSSEQFHHYLKCSLRTITKTCSSMCVGLCHTCQTVVRREFPSYWGPRFFPELSSCYPTIILLSQFLAWGQLVMWSQETTSRLSMRLIAELFTRWITSSITRRRLWGKKYAGHYQISQLVVRTKSKPA